MATFKCLASLVRCSGCGAPVAVVEEGGTSCGQGRFLLQASEIAWSPPAVAKLPGELPPIDGGDRKCSVSSEKKKAQFAGPVVFAEQRWVCGIEPLRMIPDAIRPERGVGFIFRKRRDGLWICTICPGG